VETWLKLFSKAYRSSQMSSNTFNVAEIISELVSAAKIILFQFQTWLYGNKTLKQF